MEKTIEPKDRDNCELEATTSAEDKNKLIETNNETQLDNSTRKTTCSGLEKCLTGQAVSDLESSINDDAETDRLNEFQTVNNFKFTMLLQYSKEFLGFFALIITTYATLLNKEHIIGGTLSPKPIFPSDSMVQEWPHGQLIDVQSKVAVSELSLIFFYAPWCAESLAAKNVFNSIATLYSKEAYFAAINCWQPGSSCRTNYSNVYKWPVVMAYLPNALSVQYNGPWSYNSLTTFIDGLLAPIVRVNSKDELMQLRLANDLIVFGIFTSIDSKEYQTFFQTAIKWLESISFQNAKFAVYIGLKASMFLNSEQAPVIKLLTLNETIVYDKEWVSNKVLNFLKRYLNKSSIWLNLSNAKSLTVRTYLQKGPVLLMFSPRTSPNPHYFIMRQIMYLHKNYQHVLNNNVLNNYIDGIRKEYSAKSKISPRYCKFLKNEKYMEVQTEFYNNAWSNKLLSLDVQQVNMSKQSRRGNSCNCNYCEDRVFGDQTYRKAVNNIRSSAKLDYRAPEELLRKYLQKECLHLERRPLMQFRESIITHVNTSISLDMDFPHNRTLTLLMLDSIEHSDYIRHFLGVSESFRGPPTSSALFIIDIEEEALYRQKSSISTESTIDFIRSYYNRKLGRHLRSFAVAESSNVHNSPVVKIKEINSKEFSKIIKSSDDTSVVLFYSPRCSLCSIMSQALLHVSHIVKLENVKFYRIDGSANDFSWEYAMDKYPTLIVFPQNRSIDTSVFPSSLEISVKNVFGFIMSKLKPEQQLKSLANACALTKLSYAFQTCVRYIHEIVSNEISHYLNQWDVSKDNRMITLRRLQILKDIYLKLLKARKGSDLQFISDILTFENGSLSYVL